MFRSRFVSFFPFRFSVGFVSFSVLELRFHQIFDALFEVLCRRFFLLGSRPGFYFPPLSFCCTIWLLVSYICLVFIWGGRLLSGCGNVCFHRSCCFLFSPNCFVNFVSSYNGTFAGFFFGTSVLLGRNWKWT
jgi:hypothetical protein